MSITYICPLPSCFSPSVPSSPQFSLLSEVRGLVTPQDLEHFDALVLRREIQALKARQGTAGATALQPDSLSMVSYPDTLTSSSASFMTNTTLSSARVGWVYSFHDYLNILDLMCTADWVRWDEQFLFHFFIWNWLGVRKQIWIILG